MHGNSDVKEGYFMSDKYKLLVLLAIVFFSVVPARADSFTFSFTPDQAACASMGVSCADSGSGTIFTLPPDNNIVYRGTYPITGMSGVFDGFSLSWVAQGQEDIGNGGLANYECPCGNPVTFMANGQEWGLVRFDIGPAPYTWLADYSNSTNPLEPIDLTIVKTPEPSSLLLMSIGLIGLVAIWIRKCS